MAPPEESRKKLPQDKPEMCFWRALSLMLESNRKPVMAVAQGRMTVVPEGAEQAAADYLEVPVAEIRFASFADPANPLQGFMLGGRSSANHRRMGKATRAIYARRYAPEIYPEARGLVVAQLQHEAEHGHWSAPGQRDGSEAFGTSHAAHNLTGDMAFRALAVEAEDAELLALTERHVRRLAEYLRACGTEAGTVMTVGPRAWPGNGRNAQLDGLYREWFRPDLRFPEKKVQGFDMLPVRLARRGLRLDIPAALGAVYELPVTADPIVIRRSPRGVLVYMESCGNTYQPGPQWAARSLDGVETFAQDERTNPDGKRLLVREAFAAAEDRDFWPGPGRSERRTPQPGGVVTPPSPPLPPPEPPSPAPGPIVPGPTRRTPEQVAGALRAKIREMEALVAEVEGLG